MSRVGARREREGTIPRATAVRRLAKPARHAGYAPGAHRSIGGCPAAAVKPPAFGGLDRPRTEASAGRAYLVCRAGFRRPRHAARAGHRAFHSRVRSRPEMYLGSASCQRGALRGRIGRVKLGLFLPLAGDPARLRDLLAVAATTAERTGFHSLWFAEHVALFDGPASRYPYSADGSFPLSGEAGILEPFLAIGFAAALTSRIRLGTGICLVPQRPPLYTAKQVADADVLSGGRLDFGVGIGWLREEFEALGVPFDDRAARCREHP